MRYIDDQGYDIAIRVIKYKIGIVYSFAKPKDVREWNQGEQYKECVEPNSSLKSSYLNNTVTLLLCWFLGIFGAHLKINA